MAAQAIEIEGTWEEVAARAEEFAGRRVRLTVLPEAEAAVAGGSEVTSENREMLEDYLALERTPLAPEDEAVLDDFERFRKEHPFSLHKLDKEKP